MVYVESWSNPDLLSPEQSALLDANLRAELAALAEPDAEAEVEAEAG